MLRLHVFLSVGIIAISTASIFVKLCDAPALIIATYRLMLASLMLSLFAGYKKTMESMGAKGTDGFSSPASSLVSTSLCGLPL